jgi:hypothetical protein
MEIAADRVNDQPPARFGSAMLFLSGSGRSLLTLPPSFIQS